MTIDQEFEMLCMSCHNLNHVNMSYINTTQQHDLVQHTLLNKNLDLDFFSRFMDLRSLQSLKIHDKSIIFSILSFKKCVKKKKIFWRGLTLNFFSLSLTHFFVSGF